MLAPLFHQLSHNVQITPILMILNVSSKQMCDFRLFCVSVLVLELLLNCFANNFIQFFFRRSLWRCKNDAGMIKL